MQIEIKGWIFAKPHDYENRVVFEFSQFDYEEQAKSDYGHESWVGYRKIGAHSIMVDVPGDLDPIQLKIAGLEAKRDFMRAQFTKRISEINEQISKLQALPYVVADDPTPAPVADEAEFTDIPF